MALADDREERKDGSCARVGSLQCSMLGFGGLDMNGDFSICLAGVAVKALVITGVQGLVTAIALA